MVGSDLEVRQILDLDLPGIVSEYQNIEGVLRIAGGDQLGQCHGNTFGRCNPVFAVQDHGVRNVDHQHRRGLGFVLRLADFQIRLHQDKIVDPMVDLGIADGFGKHNVLRRIAKSKGPGLGCGLISPTRLPCLVIATAGFL